MDAKLLFQELYPNGEMNDVTVASFTDNPNNLIASLVTDLGAWTNAIDKVYYNDFAREHLRIYILKHEAEHVIQFKAGRPKSYIEMANKELDAYPATQNWMLDTGNQGGRSIYSRLKFSTKDFNQAVMGAKVATKSIKLLKKNASNKTIVKIENPDGTTIVRNTNVTKPVASNMTTDRILHENMMINEYLPAFKNGKAEYIIENLYSQREDNAFYEKFGY